MDLKKIFVILIIVGIIVGATAYIMFSNNSKNVDVVNNTTNVSSNVTNGTVNATLVSNESLINGESSNSGSESDSYSESSSSSSEPEYGSNSYVNRWDESHKNDDDWAYLHDQPVKTDDDGNRYKRMYDEGSGKGYWYKMN